jgi:site-specific DNA recombinase
LKLETLYLSAARGFYLSVNPPYGCKKVRVKDGAKERCKLELEPSEAAVVEAMYKAVIEGRSLTDIAKNLNSNAIPSRRGKGWGKNVVHKILNNEINIGTFIWGRNSKRGLPPVKTENACPAIVDRDTFHRVQELMSDSMPSKRHPRRTASPILLSGIARCGYCGRALTARYAKSGKFAHYVCGTLDKKGAGSCPSKYHLKAQ